MRALFILFAILPIVEIAILVQIGGIIGGWNTIGLVVLTAFVGAYFVKREGLATLQAAQDKMQRNEIPGKEMVEGLMLVVAGILLVTPGVITDVFGLMFALPGTRHLLTSQVSKHLKMRVVTPAGGFYQQPPGATEYNPFESRKSESGNVIEGEYSDNTQNDADKRLK